MQYKLLSFLTSNSKNEVRQVFITSHSPNITAAVKLDNLIVLEHNGNNLKVSYPSKVFSCSMEDQESKLFVERFLDVTRSDMFFAKKIIFVEGLAEQLLVPEFGRMIDKDLIDQHITVINMNGRYFDHFLKLFNLNNSSFAMSKKVVCITDRDPVRKEKKIKSDDESYWKKCHPIFLNFDSEKYEYNPCSNSVLNKDIKFWSKNIGFYSQPMSLGSTLEYQMMLENIECEDLITHSVKNKPELKSLIDYYKKSIDNYKKSQEVDLKTFVDILRSNTTNNELKEIYENHHFEKKEFMKHVIATRYLESIKKGEAAQELSTKVMLINLNNNSDKTEKLDKIELNVPNYISEALKWIFK
ncbi:ATP-dependent nuclease [Enterococcus sp. JM9B]|uniref:ATP-dependent nuclease n=1 Tax=Enterococcus sp. JM9B TaxID=1857216 RepID=UPI003FA53A31